jgi:hypothetical protein
MTDSKSTKWSLSAWSLVFPRHLTHYGQTFSVITLNNHHQFTVIVKKYPSFKFWTATIFLHAHLQVVYYKCVKLHKNPISG